MPAKKKAVSGKQLMAREASPKYETAKRSLGEAFWKAFEPLPVEDKDVFYERMLEDAERREDLFDSILIMERRDEPTRPWKEVEAEMRRDGLL